LAEDRPTPDPSAARQRELAARRGAHAGARGGGQHRRVESRQDLREYAIGLLKEETERDDAAPSTSAETHASTNNFSPLAFAILIGLVSLPLLLLFAPLGIGLFSVAVLMGIWGLIDTFVVRR
jgi:hypothetical protein